MLVSTTDGNNNCLVQGTPKLSLPLERVTYSGFVEIAGTDGTGTLKQSEIELDINLNYTIPAGTLSTVTQDYAFPASDIWID